MKRYSIVYVFCFFLLICVVGCGTEGIVAKGKVTFDGKPVEAGTITFMPDGGNGPTGGGPITNGSYSVSQLAPASYKVRIIAEKIVAKIIAPVGEVDAGQEREITEQYIPVKYNDKTTLTADLQKSNKSLDFVLEK